MLARGGVIWLLLGCTYFSPAQGSAPWSGETGKVQHMLQFSGRLPDSQVLGSVVGTITVRFTIYCERDCGEAYWQETQRVRPDPQGRYTVMLGETTLGGIPSDIFTSCGKHWLGIQVSGQPEQPRILVLDWPSTRKANSITLSTAVSKKPTRGSRPTLPVILMIMFVVGAWMSCQEFLKWREARTLLWRKPSPPRPSVQPIDEDRTRKAA